METKPRKPGSGGSRPGAGKKKVPGLKPRSVLLTDDELKYLKKEHGGLTKAVRSLLS